MLSEMARRTLPLIQPELHRLMLERQRYLSHLARRLSVTTTEFDSVLELGLRGGLTPGELGERLSLSSGSVTALLDRLERLGWANRERHPDDRRKVLVRLTAAGEEVAERDLGPLDLVIQRALARFPRSERLIIERFLAKAADAAAELVAGEQDLGDSPDLPVAAVSTAASR
jgi:DNA-binding MarR family transcriptional regulator